MSAIKYAAVGFFIALAMPSTATSDERAIRLSFENGTPSHWEYRGGDLKIQMTLSRRCESEADKKFQDLAVLQFSEEDDGLALILEVVAKELDSGKRTVTDIATYTVPWVGAAVVENPGNYLHFPTTIAIVESHPTVSIPTSVESRIEGLTVVGAVRDQWSGAEVLLRNTHDMDLVRLEYCCEESSRRGLTFLEAASEESIAPKNSTWPQRFSFVRRFNSTENGWELDTNQTVSCHITRVVFSDGSDKGVELNPADQWDSWSSGTGGRDGYVFTDSCQP